MNVPATRDPRDWSPGDVGRYDGMTIQIEEVHQVKYYDDDTGQGVTYCGLPIGPGHVCDPGAVECISCCKVMATDWQR